MERKVGRVRDARGSLITSRTTVAEMVLSGFGGMDTTVPSSDHPVCFKYASNSVPMDIN